MPKHHRDLWFSLTECGALKEHVARYLVVGRTAAHLEVPYQNALLAVPNLTSALDDDCTKIVDFLPQFLSKIQPGGCVRLQGLLRTWLSEQLLFSPVELTAEAFKRVSAISEFVCSNDDDPEGNKPIIDKVAILRKHACVAEAKEELRSGVVAFASDSQYVPSTDLIAAVDKVRHIEQDEELPECLIELNVALLQGLRLQLDRKEACVADTAQHCTFHDAIMQTFLMRTESADADKAAKELRLLIEGGFQYRSRLSELTDESFDKVAPHKKVEMIANVSETLKQLRESRFVTEVSGAIRCRDLHLYKAISSKFMADVLANTAEYERVTEDSGDSGREAEQKCRGIGAGKRWVRCRRRALAGI